MEQVRTEQRAPLLDSARLEELEAQVRDSGSLWRADAYTSYAKVRDELHRLSVSLPEGSSEQSQQRGRIIEDAQRALDEALLAMRSRHRARIAAVAATKQRSAADSEPNGRLWRRRKGIERLSPRGRARSFLSRLWIQLRRPFNGLKLFYSGANIEQAWAGVHRARAALYLLYPASELGAQTAQLQEMLSQLPDLNALQRAFGTKVSHSASTTPHMPCLPPAELRDTYEEMIEASEGAQRDARALRNALMTASLAIFALVLGLGFAHAFDKQIIVLCADANHRRACPLTGSPHTFDVFAVELAGMLGGLLSVVIPLATGERIKTPYRVFNQQLILKTLAGAASAVAGVLLIESGLISGIALKSTVAILGYAVLFGFAQQIVTGAVDRRADSLAKQTPAVKDL